MIDRARARTHVCVDLTMSGVVICTVRGGLCCKFPSFVRGRVLLRSTLLNRKKNRQGEGNGAPLCSLIMSGGSFCSDIHLTVRTRSVDPVPTTSGARSSRFPRPPRRRDKKTEGKREREKRLLGHKEKYTLSLKHSALRLRERFLALKTIR